MNTRSFAANAKHYMASLMVCGAACITAVTGCNRVHHSSAVEMSTKRQSTVSISIDDLRAMSAEQYRVQSPSSEECSNPEMFAVHQDQARSDGTLYFIHRCANHQRFWLRKSDGFAGTFRWFGPFTFDANGQVLWGGTTVNPS